ncbi:MAG: aldo/keto reductase [Lachnospiraceae bacterium]|nr:aldo/keto reductase [Lachnospiraceae bacterium]
MEKIKVSENLEMSRLVAGCMRMADSGLDGDGIRNFVHTCLDLGIDTFDHAPVYGASRCESLFGEEVLAKDPAIRNQMKIVTKAGIILPGQKGNQHIFYDSTKENLLNEIDQSLQRLHTDHVDLLLVHRPDVLGSHEQTAEALDEIVKSGKALNVGVSNYDPEMVAALASYLKAPLVVNQMEFSVKAVYNFFNGVIDIAQRLHTALMAWSPLGGGSVFKGEDEQSVRLRETIEKIAADHQVSMDAVMYAFLLKHPAKIMPVTGTMNTDRIRTAVESLDLELSYDEWYGILAASRGFDVP